MGLPKDTTNHLSKVDYQKCDFCGKGANLANQRLGKLIWFRPEGFFNRYWVHEKCRDKSIKATEPFYPEICKRCGQEITKTI